MKEIKTVKQHCFLAAKKTPLLSDLLGKSIIRHIHKWLKELDEQV